MTRGNPPVLTLNEVAAATNRSYDVLRQWVRQGRLPAHRSGRHLLFEVHVIGLVNTMPRARRSRPTLPTA